MAGRFRLCFGEFQFDPSTGELRCRGEALALTKQTLALLSYLVGHRDRVVSRDELFDQVWRDVVVSDGSLGTAVYELRTLLGDDGRTQQVIRTERGRGFRFVAAVREIAAPVARNTRAAATTAGALFLGRGDILECLHGWLDDAASGHARLVLLEGEAGIGKTSLARQLATTAEDTCTHWGRCFEHAGAPPFWPWMQILRDRLAVTDSGEIRRRFGAKTAELIGRIAEPSAVLSGSAERRLDTAEDRFQLFDAVASLLRHASVDEPLLLVIDDLHHADQPSLLLLEFLAAELIGSRVLLIATYRPEDVGEGHPLAATLGGVAHHPHCERIRLQGLDAVDVHDLLATVTGDEPSPAFLHSVMQRSEGNPFFVKELARHIGSADDAPWSGEVPVPSLPHSVQEVVGRRLARLSPATREALAVAAVFGREFRIDALARTWDGSSPLSPRWLEESVRSHVVTREHAGRARFAHTLFHEALYSRLDPGRRGALHRRAGEALETLCGSPGAADLSALAHHFAAGLSSGGSPAKATAYAVAAAHLARELLAYEEAAQHYTWALRAVEWQEQPDPRTHAELLLGLAEASKMAGDAAAARDAFARAAAVARSGGAPALLARAALGYAAARDAVIRIDVQAGEQPDRQLAGALLAEALEAVGHADLGMRSRLLAASAVHSSDLLDQRAARSRDAHAIAERLGDSALLAEVVAAQREVLWTPEHVERRLELAERLVRLAAQAGDRERELCGRAWRLTDLLELGEVEQVRRELGTCERLAREIKQPKYDHHVAVLRATLAVLDGRLEEGERLAQDAVVLGRRMRIWVAEVIYMAQLMGIRREQGRLGEIEAMVRARVAGFPHPALRCALSYFAAETGSLDEAREEFERLAPANFSAVPRDRHWLGAMALLCLVCARLGDRRGAAVLYDLLLPFAGRNVVSGEGLISHGAVSHHLGDLASILGRWSEAEQHFRAALVLNERLGARAFLGQIQRAFAGMLIARNAPGDRAEALHLIEAALAIAARHGSQGLHGRLVELRESARSVPPAV